MMYVYMIHIHTYNAYILFSSVPLKNPNQHSWNNTDNKHKLVLFSNALYLLYKLIYKDLAKRIITY